MTQDLGRGTIQFSGVSPRLLTSLFLLVIRVWPKLNLVIGGATHRYINIEYRSLINIKNVASLMTWLFNITNLYNDWWSCSRL